MKKFSLILAAFAVLLVSCERDATRLQVSDSQSLFTIKATAEENTITKATYDSDGRFTWATDDCIGVHRIEVSGDNTYTWNEEMLLQSGNGQTEGTFKPKNNDGTAGKKFGPVAFYPYTGQSGEGGTNLYAGTLYFRLKNEIAHSATSHPLPLAVQIPETAGDQTITVKFSQIGAGVRVSLNNVPAKANKLSLTVAGKNIVGEFPIAQDKIGADDADCPNAENALRESVVQGTGSSTVSYTFATASASRNMEFIFPMPTTALPSLELNLYIEGEKVPVWSATTPAQPTLGRGDLLDMPKLALAEPYYIYLLDWSDYYRLYVYGGDAGEIFGGWPGKVSTGTETISIYDNCHRFSVPAKYKGKKFNIVFNSDNGQTGNILNVTLGDNHYLYFKKSGEQVSF